MERKKTRLNESEMKVMQIIWNAGHPITGQQVLGQITEQYKGSWHPRTIYPLMRKLSEKGMIRDVGSARVGKVYARQFLPAISRPEYMALRIMSVRKQYELYDNKICTGDEAAECRGCLGNRMQSIGYELVVDRGDAPV